MNCMDMSVPMQSSDFFSDCTRLRNVMFSDDVEVDSFTSTITKSTYHPVSISTIVDTQKHLSVEYREILSTMLIGIQSYLTVFLMSTHIDFVHIHLSRN